MDSATFFPELEAVKAQKTIADIEYSYVSFKNLPEELSQWVRTSDLDLMRKSKQFKKNSTVLYSRLNKAGKESNSLSTRSRRSSQLSQAESSRTFKLEAETDLISSGLDLEAKYYGLGDRLLGKRSMASLATGRCASDVDSQNNSQVDQDSVELLKEKIFGRDQYLELKNSKTLNKKSTQVSSKIKSGKQKKLKT